MAYISRVLTKNIENGGIKRSKKVEFFIKPEELGGISTP